LRQLLGEARERAGLSARALSLKLHKQPTFIARVERGERLLEVVELIDICKALNLDCPEIIERVTISSKPGKLTQ